MSGALAERIDTPSAPVTDPDHRVVIHGVTWQQYVTLRETLDDIPGLRIFYLEGSLEIMTPSRTHEISKKLIARLVEIFALERDIHLNGYGSTTFRKEAKTRGLEPDECYCLGELKDVPDIALEVVISSGGLDKLDIYQGLSVPEVWFWEHEQLAIFNLTGGGYERAERSRFLPDLDVALLARYVVGQDNQTAAVKAFRDAIR